MRYYDDGLDYSKPADREIIEKRKQKEREQRIKEAKEERRLYLKRQINKTKHNRQTMNSYIVHKEKQKNRGRLS